jgi:hypothetical protein
MRRAASRADCTAGKSNATRMPIIAMTTSNSTKVKPGRVPREDDIAKLLSDLAADNFVEREIPRPLSQFVEG